MKPTGKIKSRTGRVHIIEWDDDHCVSTLCGRHLYSGEDKGSRLYTDNNAKVNCGTCRKMKDKDDVEAALVLLSK